MLTLDFPGPRSRHRLRRLEIAAPGVQVVHLLDAVRPRDVTARAYARTLLDSAGLAGREVSAIVAHCAAASIARELDRLLRRAGRAGPRLYAINPEPADLDTAAGTLRTFLTEAGSPAGPDDEPLTRAAIGRAEERLFLSHLAEGGRETPGMARMARELAAAQADWVTYLAAAGDPDAPPTGAAEVHVTSRDHPCPPSCVARHLVIGDVAAELFAGRELGALIANADDPGSGTGPDGRAGRDVVTAAYLRRCRRSPALLKLADAVSGPPPASVFEHRALARPFFRPRSDMDDLGDDLLGLFHLLNALPRRFFGDAESFLAAQGQPSRRAEIIRRGCVGALDPYARADAIIQDGSFRVIEFNVGSDIGGVEAALMNRLLLEQDEFRRFAGEFALGHTDTAQVMADLLRAVAGAVVGADDPVVGLIEETGSGGTCRHVARALRARGLRVELGELNQLSTAGGKVTLRGNQPLDVVLRYFFVEHLMHEPDGPALIDDLAQAHRYGRTAFFTPLDSELISNKAVMGLLHHDIVRSGLSSAERALVDRLIPRTRLLGDNFTIVRAAHQRALLDECVERRQDLVLKPAFGNNSVGVLPGARIDAGEWRSMLAAPKLGGYVVQDRVVPDREIVLDPGTGAGVEWDVNWGVFVSGAGYSGSFVRALDDTGGREVIGSSARTRYGVVFTY
ncbi:hypothetical protein [Nonomuraea zeae]|uniref:Circularly permuted type 2 ATP-grasp protein n=1 Tax=Nonomuraea zeae TaxID=1642303 RepID=A0A5S4FP21_9ACTN|nr:hypothetical protein [Nonomuraea zeae]TMR21951.1 circularly permuted type 2 ATP-grasp protein [Nonomuraea zeae]